MNKEFALLKKLEEKDNSMLKADVSNIIINLASNPNICSNLIDDIFYNDNYRFYAKYFLSRNKNVSKDILISVLNSPSFLSNLDEETNKNRCLKINELKSLAMKNENLTSEEITNYYNKAKSYIHNMVVLKFIPYNKNTPSNILVNLYYDFLYYLDAWNLSDNFKIKDNIDTIPIILRHNNFPVDLINNFVEYDEEIDNADNTIPFKPDSSFDNYFNNKILLKNRKIKNRMFGIANSNIKKETLIKLSDDENYLIRFGIALNANTPQDILEKLSVDFDPLVVNSVISNNNVESRILENIIENLLNNIDGNKKINFLNNKLPEFDKLGISLLALALTNPNISSDFIDNLTLKYYNKIEKNFNNNFTNNYLNFITECIFQSILRNPNVKNDIVRRIFNACISFNFFKLTMGFYFAECKNTDKDIISYFYNQTDKHELSMRCISNPAFNTDDLYDILYKTEDLIAISEIAKNPNLTPDLAYTIFYLTDYIVDKYQLNFESIDI